MTDSQQLRKNLDFEEKHAALREDVHRLGEMVGDMIGEQGGGKLFEAVEQARRASISGRENPDGGQGLKQVLSQIPGTMYGDLVRSFAAWFQVVNTAEQIHRIRRRRAYLQERSRQQPNSIGDTVMKLREQGLGAEDMIALLDRLRFEAVFTAHPTEPTRRTILRKEQRIGQMLLKRLDSSRTPREDAAIVDEIQSEIALAWQTDEHPGQKTTVADEQEHVLFYLTDVLYRAIPDFYEAFREALVNAYGERGREMEIPTLLRVASQVGGDLESSPQLTGKVIKQTLARHRKLILNLYFEECRQLAEQLSQSAKRISIDPALQERTEQYMQWFPSVMHEMNRRHRDMPYRVMFRLVMERLQHTYDELDKRYRRAEEFLEDLRLIARSLGGNKGSKAGLHSVQRLLRRAETFRFRLATLDIRQDARVLRHAVGQCLESPEWMGLAPEVRIARLHQAFDEDWDPALELDPEARKALATFESLAMCRRKFGHSSVGPFIVSGIQGCDDLLSALLLARWAGLSDRAGNVPLDIIPQFETMEELAGVGKIMRPLLRDRIYRQHLRSRENEQVVMLEYSGSNRESGLLASRWAAQHAHEDVAAITAAEQVGLTLFLGRGGTSSRGGSGILPALLASPPGGVRGRLRSIEQGETINSKYGLPGIALRNFERAVGALALTSSGTLEQITPREEWLAVMEQLSSISERAYRGLVFEDPRFEDYFRAITPIDVLERMQSGGRDDDDAGQGPPTIAQMRPLIWFFAWTQNRLFLPVWYGVGRALDSIISDDGLETLQQMYREWPFFQAILDDVEMVLAKTELSIARHYNALAPEELYAYFGTISDEYARCRKRLLAIKQQDKLLDNFHSLQRSIRLRTPYVDPISLLQVDLLRQWRQGGHQNENLLEALMASVNGIAEAVQNTG